MEPEVIVQDEQDWDDSALIDSWDAALTEYKKYHSIKSQGKRLEDVLTKDELETLRADYGDLGEDEETNSQAEEDIDHADQMDAEPPEAAGNANGQALLDVTQAEEITAPNAQEPLSKTIETKLTTEGDEAHAAFMPEAILGTVQDENVKNLMMAWYYAGYYTGIQTGQQPPSAPDSNM